MTLEPSEGSEISFQTHMMEGMDGATCLRSPSVLMTRWSQSKSCT